MTKKFIYANTGTHALLDKGSVACLGYVTETYQIEPIGKNGRFQPLTTVCFHFGSSAEDFFYFLDDKPVFNSHVGHAPDFIVEVYTACLREKANPEEFIARVTETFVLAELGF